MPIRFRCAYCNQLLGIARRKAGTVVRCPTCSGEVVVPRTEEAARAARGGFFEENEFENLFGDEPQAQTTEPAPRPDARPAPPTGAWGTHADPVIEVERVDVPRGGIPGAAFGSASPGLFLSPARATILTVAVLLALLLAFGLGLLVGRWSSLPAPAPPPPAAGTVLPPIP